VTDWYHIFVLAGRFLEVRINLKRFCLAAHVGDCSLNFTSMVMVSYSDSGQLIDFEDFQVLKMIEQRHFI
jgi:hypothetical protein